MTGPPATRPARFAAAGTVDRMGSPHRSLLLPAVVALALGAAAGRILTPAADTVGEFLVVATTRWPSLLDHSATAALAGSWTAGVAGVLLAAALAAPALGWARATLSTAAASAVAGAGAVALRLLVNRPRPNGDGDLLTSAMPSGHVLRAAVAAGLLTWAVHQYRRRWLTWLAGLPLAAAVAAVALSRVAVGAHWGGDAFVAVVLAGGAVASATLVTETRRLPAPPP